MAMSIRCWSCKGTDDVQKGDHGYLCKDCRVSVGKIRVANTEC